MLEVVNKMDKSNQAEIGKGYNFGLGGFPVVCIKEEFSKDYNNFTFELNYEEGAVKIKVRKEDTFIVRDRVLIINEGRGVGWIVYHAGNEQVKERRSELLKLINEAKL